MDRFTRGCSNGTDWERLGCWFRDTIVTFRSALSVLEGGKTSERKEGKREQSEMYFGNEKPTRRRTFNIGET
jgi:hypothetical protein